ncbi:helix-turn-helix domain-containing protein [Amycolatopsis suaedae]|uniref:XRE family transcriptional regulator n=1 Tax=Amycolatopsis suaedae TaxID=2510978 RepID=A0A4Q7J3W1_9PSEU|nr:helix-turn-helix transcriptional regulator [Amycolatopsis suaedae]RZQ61023.1 XRE family transcriptional regulator [Amycolatopsis suaedae]
MTAYIVDRDRADEVRAPRTEYVGSLLRELREQACLTQEELAERSGVSIRTISDLERGRTRKPHRKSVALLSAALGMGDIESERFRRIARIAAVSSTPHAPDELEVGGTTELAQWMCRVLVDEPTRQQRVLQVIARPTENRAALVARASARFRTSFPDGRYYVDAADGTLLPRLGDMFGIEDKSSALVERLRSALHTRRALLVLDNVTDASAVRPLLTTGSGSVLVVIAPHELALGDNVWTVNLRAFA